MIKASLVLRPLLSLLAAACCALVCSEVVAQSATEGKEGPVVVTLRGGPATASRVRARLAQAPSLQADDYGLTVPEPRAAARPTPLPLLSQADLLPGPAPQPRGGGDLAPELTLAPGKFVVVRANDLKSVVVGDPEVLDVVVLTSKLLLLTGKSAGTTQLLVRDGEGLSEHTVNVEAADRLAATEIEASLGVPGVKVTVIKDSIILDGDVEDENQMERARQIAELFAENVISFLTVQQQEGPVESPALAKQIAEAIQMDGVAVRVANDTAILSGTVDSDEQRIQAEKVAALFASDVISLLKKPVPTAQEIQDMIANDNITVKAVRDYLVLEGAVQSADESTKAEEIANLSGLQVLNRLALPDTQVADDELAEKIRQALKAPGVEVTVTDGTVLLQGAVPSEDEAKRLTQMAQLFSNNVNAILDVAEPPQVRVEVQVLEIARNDLDDIGMTYPQDFLFGETAVNSSIVRQTPVTMAIKALVQENKAKVLSRPSTTVLSGKQATLNVGGQVPIPRATESTGGPTLSRTVEFQDFGIILEVTPTVDRQGNITMTLHTEVSEPDFTIGVTIDGGLVPGFRRRSSDTEVFVRDGDTLVLAGLFDTEVRKAVTKFPILGDIPILGNLFRSTHYQNDESELVILVSPNTITSAPLG